MFDPHQHLLDAIKKKKARIVEIDSLLALPPLPHSTGRVKLAQERVHLEQEIAELDAELRRVSSLTAQQTSTTTPMANSPSFGEPNKTAIKDPIPMFRWEDVDHSLISLRLTELSIEMNAQITKDEARIEFENRANLNSMTVPSLILKMRQERAEEWARRSYEIYCDVWQKQGYVRNAAFIRAVAARSVLPTFRAQTGAIVADFSLRAKRTSFPTVVLDATLGSFRMKMQRLEDSWRRRFEIEAKELEHAERRAKFDGIPKTVDHKTATEVSAGASQTSMDEIGPNVIDAGDVASTASSKNQRPGPRPRLDGIFVVYAGSLWREALPDGKATVPGDRLRGIASSLDHEGYLPPSNYLEGNYARELKAYNSRNSNSKLGPIKTWSQLISLDDKYLLQGMRRLLSRCAQKSKNDLRHP